MVEPSRTDGDVRLTGAPCASVRVTLLQHVHHRVAGRSWIRHDTWIDCRPVGLAGGAALITNPPDVGPGVREDHCVRLVPPDEPPHARPVVDLLAAVRPFAVGAA